MRRGGTGTGHLDGLEPRVPPTAHRSGRTLAGTICLTALGRSGAVTPNPISRRSRARLVIYPAALAASRPNSQRSVRSASRLRAVPRVMTTETGEECTAEHVDNV